MKRKNIILVMLLVLSGIFTMQSCKKDEAPTPVIYKAAVPQNPTPAAQAVIPLIPAGNTVTLTWEGVATTTWDVYFGSVGYETLVASGLKANTYTITTDTSGEFNWYVQTMDANKVFTKSPTWIFFINSPPTAPILTSPKNDSIGFPVTGALEWSATDAQGDALTYEVYLGTSSTPGVVATGLTDATYSPSMVAETKYYWKIVATDIHGASASSVVHSFTTGLEPIMTFTGAYTADEPAEAYSYDVNFTKATSTSIAIDLYWNSWPAEFAIDLSNLTYSMANTTFTSGYSGIESGIIDPATGTMTGTYTIWQNGVSIEQGVHTYTKK
jgi:hypothetical protein